MQSAAIYITEGLTVWDDDEPKRTDKPYLWILFFLLLLGMSSIFFLRPGVNSPPRQQTPSAEDLPVVSLIDAKAHGQPLFSASAQTGIWAVHTEGGRALVRFLNALGDEQWAETVPVDNALIASRGRYLVIGEVGEPKFYVYHARQKLALAVTTPGALQALSISQTGEVFAAFTVPQTDPLALRTEVALYSALGHLAWRTSLAEQQPLDVGQSADGNTVALLSLSFAEDVTGSLTVYSRNGERLFDQDFAERPGLLTVRDDGEGVAVTAGNDIYVFDRQGQLTLRHDAGGAVESLGYVGVHPIFTVVRRSVFNLRLEYRAVVLGENGRITLEHRSRQPLVALSTAPQGRDIFIGTPTSVALIGSGGESRWSLTHDWQGAYRAATLDGVHYLVVKSDGQVVQVRGD
ncbi:MAG: hypothetical protein DDT39_00446 [Firmicutes bacterium]|nr:hypothetical protein [candidate division NPL-UPA2 bacterium]